MKSKTLRLHVYPLMLAAIIALMVNPSTEDKSVKDPVKYDEYWKIIDSLEMSGLPKSAQQYLETVYRKAYTENNTDQLIRAMTYKLKFISYYEENPWLKEEQLLKKEIAAARPPARQVMHAMMAAFYQKYYDQFQWQILQRSYAKGNVDSVMTSWDLVTLRQHIIAGFDSSLNMPEKYATINVRQYNQFIEKGTAPENIRPTLYDFLLHQAIDFYTSSETELQRPADYFNLNNPDYFADIKTFINHPLSKSDSLSSEYQAVKLYQRLLNFRLLQKSPLALAYADLDRIEYVYNHSSLGSKDSLYKQTLDRMEKSYASSGAEPEIIFRKAIYTLSQTNNGKNNSARLDALGLFESILKKFPQSQAARNAAIEIKNLKTGEISIDGLKYECPSSPFAVKISYRVDSVVYLRVYKTEPVDDNTDYRSDFDKYEYMVKKGNMVFFNQYRLPSFSDLNPHTTEIILPGFDPSFYLIVIADNEKFVYDSNDVSFYNVQITNLSLLYTYDNNTGFNFYCVSRENGMPMQGVKATVMEMFYNQKRYRYERKEAESFITDENGRFGMALTNKYRQFNIKLSHGDETIIMQEVFSESGYNSPWEPEPKKTWIITDRRLYRPGQTVYFKGLFYLTKNADTLLPIKQKFLEAILYDVNGQQNGKLSLKTNDFGTFNGSFVLPPKGLNGAWHIQTNYGTCYIQVEEYKRPRFEFSFEPVDKPIKIGDSMILTGKALTYAGAALADAKVEYSVSRKASRWWWWFSTDAGTMVSTGELKCDKMGQFSIAFKADPDFSDPGFRTMYYNFTVSVKISDITGETHSDVKSFALGHSPVKLKNDAGDDIEITSAGSLTVSAINFNNKPVVCKGKLTIEKLKIPEEPLTNRLWATPDQFMYDSATWVKQFPGNVYKNENKPEYLPVDRLIDNYLVESNVPIKIPFHKFETGYYRFSTEMTDEKGIKTCLVTYHRLYSATGKVLPTLSPLSVVKMKNECKPGEINQLLFGTNLKNAPILTSWQRRNAPFNSQWIMTEKTGRSLSMPVTESDRGGFYIEGAMLYKNRVYQFFEKTDVPFDNKELSVVFRSFRDKLQPGEQEKWEITVEDFQGNPSVSEMALTLYDASLDQIYPHKWFFSGYGSFYATVKTHAPGIQTLTGRNLRRSYPAYVEPSAYTFDIFNWYGYTNGYYYPAARRSAMAETLTAAGYDSKAKMIKSTAPGKAEQVFEVVENVVQEPSLEAEDKAGEPLLQQPEIKIRTNFNETAFFYPDLKTDEKGNLSVSFTIPEALTRWKCIGFAHSQKMEYAVFSKELVTRKELMLTPNLPRFFRESDSLIFSAKLDNLSGKLLSGKAMLWFTNAVSGEDVTKLILTNSILDFNVKAGENAKLEWPLKIPAGCPPLIYHIQATSEKLADAEQGMIPVLPNRRRVIETMPLWISGKGEKTFQFSKFISNTSPTLMHDGVTFEFTPNPTWYAIQALPYLTEDENESTERTFSRFFANAASAWLLRSDKGIKNVIDVWKKQPESSLFYSNLEKNQELKNIVLEHTPWVTDALDEKEQKQRLLQLFDENRLKYDMDECLDRLKRQQHASGGWPWFEGMPVSRFITQWIVSGLGRIDHLGMVPQYKDKINKITSRAVDYLDHELSEDFKVLKKRMKPDELIKYKPGYYELNYLWTRSYFNIDMDKEVTDAYDFYYKQAKLFWLEYPEQIQAKIALLCSVRNENSVSFSIVKSLSERAVHNEEMGMYWRNLAEGRYWYNGAIETQATMIELYDVVAHDSAAVEELKRWLLKNKQTNRWHSSKATVEAVYALINRGENLLTTSPGVILKAGNEIMNPATDKKINDEAGTGYFKKVFSPLQIKPEMGNVTVTKSTPGPGWGAMYWQYTEDLDKISGHNTSLTIGRKLFIERITPAGRSIVAVDSAHMPAIGDRLIVRIDLYTDRDLEYVHLQDMRAASLEPDNPLSGYRWRDGLGYYQSMKDASADFFFHWLPKGTYIFEYELFVSQKGRFSNGISTVQCLYAPEFAAHSEGIVLEIDN